MTDSDGHLGNPPQPGTPADFSGADSGTQERIQVKPENVLGPIPPNPFARLDQVSNMGTFTLSKKGTQPASTQDPVNTLQSPTSTVRVGTEIAGRPQSPETKAQQEKIIALREEISSLSAQIKAVFRFIALEETSLIVGDVVYSAKELEEVKLEELDMLRRVLRQQNPKIEEVETVIADIKEMLAGLWSSIEEQKQPATPKTEIVDPATIEANLKNRVGELLPKITLYRNGLYSAHDKLKEDGLKEVLELQLKKITDYADNPASYSLIEKSHLLEGLDFVERQFEEMNPSGIELSQKTSGQEGSAENIEETNLENPKLEVLKERKSALEKRLKNIEKEKIFTERNRGPFIDEIFVKIDEFFSRYSGLSKGSADVLSGAIEQKLKDLEEMLSEEEKAVTEAREKRDLESKSLFELHNSIVRFYGLRKAANNLFKNPKLDQSFRASIFEQLDKLQWLPQRSKKEYDLKEIEEQLNTLAALIESAEESLRTENEKEQRENQKIADDERRAQEKRNAEQEESIKVLNELNELLPALLSTSKQLEAIIPKMEDAGRRDELTHDDQELHALHEEIKNTKTEKRLAEFKVRLAAHEKNVEEESRILAEKEAELENSLALNVFDGWPSTIRFVAPKHNPKQGQPAPKTSGRWVISKNGIDKTIDAKDTQLFNSMKTNFDKTFKEYLDFIAEPNSNKKIAFARNLIIVKNTIIAALVEEKTEEAQRLIRSFSTVLNETAELWKKKVEEEEKSLLESKKRQAEKVALEGRMKKKEEALAEVEETHRLLEPYINGEDVDGIISKKTELKKFMERLMDMKNKVHITITNGEKGAEEYVSIYENLLDQTKLILGQIESEINETEKRLNKKYNRKTGQFETKEESVIRTPSAQVPADKRTYSFKDKKTGEWKTVDANGWKEEQERRVEEQERISAMTPEQMLAEGIDRREEKSGEQAYLDFLERDPKGFKQAYVGKKWSYGDPLKKVVTNVIKKYVDRLRTKQVDMNDRLNKHRAEAERLGEGEGGYNTLAAAGYEEKLKLLGDEIDSLDENMISQAELDKRKVAEERAKAHESQSLKSTKQTFKPPKGVTKLPPIAEGLTQEQLREYKAPDVPLKSDDMIRSIDMNDPSDAWRKNANDLQYVEKQGEWNSDLEEKEAAKKRKFTAVKNLFESLQKFVTVDPKIPSSAKMRTRRLILGGSLAAVTSAIMLAALLPDDKDPGSKSIARSIPRTADEAVPLKSWREYVTGKLAPEELKVVVGDVVDNNIGFNNFAQKYFTEMHIDPNNPESLSTVAKLEPFVLMSDAPTCAGTNKDQRKQLCDYVIRLQQIGDATYARAREAGFVGKGYVPNTESMGPKPRETFEEYFMRIREAAVKADSRYEIALAQRNIRI